MQFMCIGKWRGLGEDGQQRMLAVYEGWKPPKGLQILQHWVTPSGGDFVVVEVESPEALGEGIANWAPFIDYEVYPISPIGDAFPGLKRAMLERADLG